MRNNHRIIALIVCIAVIAAGQLSAQNEEALKDILRDVNLNDGAETYALAFRNMPGGMEAWLTVASEVGDVALRQLARAECSKEGFKRPVVVADPALNAPESKYNGVPTFNPCNPNEAVIVSDRSSSGTARRSNDLYTIRLENNKWNATRLSISSGAWDDTPAFGPTGNTLYFSSDRRRPGSGSADLYMVQRTSGGWSEPTLLSSICTDRHHESSPFVSSDGVLYYSTNTHGDQDIWYVKLNKQTGMPEEEPKKFELPGVNLQGSDEYHPVITPGGAWILFSSNRLSGTSSNEFRLYHRKMPVVTHTLNLKVTARTKIRDETKQRYFGKLDSIYNVKTSIEFQKLPNIEKVGLRTDNAGNAQVQLSSDETAGPFTDSRLQTFVLSAVPHERGYVGGVDTVMVDVANCKADIDHVMYLDDTTTKSRTCEFTFRTFNVPFFVTTYWCPTTLKYKKYTPCTSLFVDEISCETLKQPEHCQTNEAYNYKFIPAKLERTTRNAENCVNYGEFNSHGKEWAEEVDANIERMRDEVGAALNEPCIQEAISKGYSISVTYIGTTDDRSIHPKCQYTGAEYEEISQVAPDIEVDTAVQSFISPGKHFNGGGYGGKAGGNQLLSDLRSLYFAILFDNICKESISTYRQLRADGKLKVRSRGQAIDQRDLPYEFKRAAGVEIRIPNFEIISKGFDSIPHRTIKYCESEGCQ